MKRPARHRILALAATAAVLTWFQPVWAGGAQYETDAAHGRVIFIRNPAAREAREAAAAAGLVVRSLPEWAAEAATRIDRQDAGPTQTSVTDPQQAQFEEFLRGLRDDDSTAGPSAGVPATRPAGAGGPDFWAERDRQSLAEHADTVRIADAFLAVHGQAFGRARPATAHKTAPAAWKSTAAAGLASGPHTALVARSAEKDHLGMTHVRYRQEYKGVPVFGAEAIVQVNALGRPATANGMIAADLPEIDTTPAISADQAAAIAEANWYADAGRANLPPERKHARLLLLQPGLLDNTGDNSAYLVWEVELSHPAWIDESYFIDATSGELRLKLDHVRRLNRWVFDCSATQGSGNDCYSNLTLTYDDPYYPWTPPPEQFTFGCREGLCPRGGSNPRYSPDISTDTDDLYATLSDVHSYYQTKFNRNGANGQGGNTDGTYAPLNEDDGWTYVDWLSSWAGKCPSAAYWRDNGVGFCKDMLVPDVVGHEYAHGVNTNLVYQGQSGALDESHSDFMGEMFEYWATGSNDWVVAGALGMEVYWSRSLANPPSIIDPGYGGGGPYPDSLYSSNVYCGTADSGGVHHNSTVLSKALYLASMGGAFNGCTINAIGREKVEQVLHRAKTLYWAASETFNGAYLDLIQSCGDLYGSGSEDCRQLTRALQAVELDQAGRCADPGGLLWYPPEARDIRADLRPDFHVDTADLELFVGCASGPAVPHNGSRLCQAADFDADNDVDQEDFGVLQRCFSGPDVPADPACNP